jgi:hypothetical protein
VVIDFFQRPRKVASLAQDHTAGKSQSQDFLIIKLNLAGTCWPGLLNVTDMHASSYTGRKVEGDSQVYPGWLLIIRMTLMTVGRQQDCPICDPGPEKSSHLTRLTRQACRTLGLSCLLSLGLVCPLNPAWSPQPTETWRP